MYNKFAYIYDKLTFDIDYRAWADYLKKIFKDNGVEEGRILDLGTGTGTIPYHMGDDYNYTCLDLSPDMIKLARERLKDFDLAEFIVGNMRDYRSEVKFQGLMSNCDSVNYLVELEDLDIFFENSYFNLEKDGVFVFDINSPYKLREILGNNTYIYEYEDIFYSWENYLYDDENVVEFFLNFFLQDDFGKYERFREEHAQGIFYPELVKKILEKNGFKNIKIYDSFTFSDSTEKSDRFTFVAIK